MQHAPFDFLDLRPSTLASDLLNSPMSALITDKRLRWIENAIGGTAIAKKSSQSAECQIPSGLS